MVVIFHNASPRFINSQCAIMCRVVVANSDHWRAANTHTVLNGHFCFNVRVREGWGWGGGHGTLFARPEPCESYEREREEEEEWITGRRRRWRTCPGG